MGGREVSTVLEISDLAENDFVRMVSDAGGTTWDSVFRLTQADEHCRLQLTMDAIPQRLPARLLAPVFISLCRSAVAGDMDAVKAYCESRAAEAKAAHG